MTRPSRASRTPSLATRFRRDPVGVIIGVLAQAQEPMGKREIGARLQAGGVDSAAFERAWRSAQERVRFDDHVIYDRQRYRWTQAPREIPIEEQIFRLTRSPEPGTGRRLMALVREALESAAGSPAELAMARSRVADAEARIADLQQRIDELRTAAPLREEGVPASGGPDLPVSQNATGQRADGPAADGSVADGSVADGSVAADAEAHAQYERAERRRQARERQARIDAMSTVAELAAEVEELTAKQATPEVLLEHTRAVASGRGLEPIGRAGEVAPFDEQMHEPVGGYPGAGEPVTVIRPGYLWHAPGEAVLISKALVTRAKGQS